MLSAATLILCVSVSAEDNPVNAAGHIAELLDRN
jgi:hypothetical protein